MAASHLRFEALGSQHATDLPIKVTVQACTPQGEVDVAQSGRLSFRVCKSLCDDRFEEQTLRPWTTTTDARSSSGQVCDVAPKAPSEGDPGTITCLQIKGGVGDAKMDRNWAKGVKRNLANIRPTKLRFNVKTNSAEHETGVLFLTDANDRVCTVFALRDGGKMGIEDELINFPSNVRTDFRANTWYCVQLLFDWTTQVFDLIVNGAAVGRRIPFEDQLVTSLGYAYISNSHPSSETLWDRFQCADDSSVPTVELEVEPFLNQGIWQGHLSFESVAENVFLEAHLEEIPSQLSDRPHGTPPANACTTPLGGTRRSMSMTPCEERTAAVLTSPTDATSLAQNLTAAAPPSSAKDSSSLHAGVTTFGAASPSTPLEARASTTGAADAAQDGGHRSGSASGGGDSRAGTHSSGVARQLFAEHASGAEAGGSREFVGGGGGAAVLGPTASSASRISASYVQQQLQLQHGSGAACAGAAAALSSRLNGRSDAFSLFQLEKDAVSRGNSTAMTRDVLSLLDNPEISDLTLVVEGRKIHVHRAILFARSTHFRSMFTSGMRECEDGLVHIPDAPYDAMKVMLVYLYTGDVPLTPALAMPVLCLADRYMIAGLKRLCESVLVGAINIETVVVMLEAATQYSASHLQQECLSFAVAHFQELVHTADYFTLDPKIMILVQRAVAPHVHCSKALPLGAGREAPCSAFCSPGRSSHA